MRYVIYCKGRRPADEHTRLFVPIFEDISIAKAFLITFMSNEPLNLMNNRLSWSDSYELRAEDMDRIVEAEVGLLPEHYARQILQFKYGQWEPRTEPKTDGATKSNDGIIKAPSLVRERKPGRPTGYVTITELAMTWGIPAMHARAALRASDRVKPEFGWSFSPSEIPTIKKICGVK